MAKSKGITIGTLGLIILILVTIFTWPSLQIQPRNLKSITPFNNEVGFKVNAWNKAGDISGFSIITPMACFRALVSDNLTCNHKGEDCTTHGFCYKVPAGEITSDHTFNVDVSDEINNFSINVSAKAQFGFLIVRKTTKNFFCKLNETTSSYNCKDLN